MLPVQCALIFLLLHGKLAAQAIPGVGGSLYQILPFLTHPLRLLPAFIKGIQQS